ncbi:MAG: DUF2058 domain-containing protein [Gammaproteobacteria bacterium]|nr:DUF2058 domain-containing protein [Gammaproteobacteria bacterium]
MGNSLQDQLIGAGLIDRKKANKLKSEQNKQQRQKRKSGQPERVANDSSKQQEKDAAARDKALNLRREQQRAQRAITAQIRQLVATHGVAEDKEAEIGFNFVVDGKVKKIYVSQQSKMAIGNGKLAIVRVDGRFRLLPSQHLDKVRQRDPGCILLHNAPQQQERSSEAHDYPDHQVPDDLMW